MDDLLKKICLPVEIEAALDKIYGKPLPGEVVDVQAAPVLPALTEGKQ